MSRCTVSDCTYSDKNVRRGLCGYHYNIAPKSYSRRDAKEDRPAIVEGNVAKIPLGIRAKGGYAIVDSEQAFLANEYKWNLSTTGYAVTASKERVRVHHIIYGKPGKGLVFDHINGNRLDNRSSNIRLVTIAQNQMNRKPSYSGLSTYKGVSWHKQAGKWRSYVKLNGKQKSLGLHSSEKDAATAYDKAAREFFGEYALTNNILKEVL